MILKQITKPAQEPITLTDVESQCRVDPLSDESLAVERFITAMRQRAEGITRRALITQTWELILDSFPFGRNVISIPLPPLQSVDSITYYDTNNVLQTLSSSLYRVLSDGEPSRIIPVYGESWPVALDDIETVRIRFTCGYGPVQDSESINVPESIRQWILLNVASLYENRETVVVGKNSVIEIHTFADSLLEDFRVRGW